MELYQLVVENYKRDKWKARPFDGMLEIKNTKRDQLLPFLKLCVSEISEGGTFVDAAFSFLTPEEFREIVDFTFQKAAAETWSTVLLSVVDYASLQFPELLLPYHERLVKRRGLSYADRWAWRGAGALEIDFLSKLIKSGNAELAHDAWECLVNIRTEEAIQRSYELFDLACERRDIGFNTFAHDSGFELKNGECRKLFFDDTYHIVFSSEYRAEQNKHRIHSVNITVQSKENHPTWHAEQLVSDATSFGGSLHSKCGCCGEKLHQLVRVPKKYLGNCWPITFATCLSCLGWEEHILFFVHDEQGTPLSYGKKENFCVPEFPGVALKEAEVSLVKTAERWKFQDWGLSNNRENLNRIGGMPTWVQGAEYPDCPCCHRTMTFCAQLDSALLTETGEEWLWGSGGICYLFLCDECRMSGSLWQCT